MQYKLITKPFAPSLSKGSSWFDKLTMNVIILLYFGYKRQDDVFKNLKTLLEPFVAYSAYQRHLATDKHQVGKSNTQKIERENLNFRTWIKRLTRKTICFSKLDLMHDTNKQGRI